MGADHALDAQAQPLSKRGIDNESLEEQGWYSRNTPFDLTFDRIHMRRTAGIAFLPRDRQATCSRIVVMYVGGCPSHQRITSHPASVIPSLQFHNTAHVRPQMPPRRCATAKPKHQISFLRDI